MSSNKRVKITSFQEVLDIVLSFNVKLEDHGI